MWLNFHECSLVESHIPQNDLWAFLKEKVLHHPHWQMAHAFLCWELEHTAIGFLGHLRVAYHKGHWVGDSQSSQLCQSWGWQNDLVSFIYFRLSDKGWRINLKRSDKNVISSWGASHASSTLSSVWIWLATAATSEKWWVHILIISIIFYR